MNFSPNLANLSALLKESMEELNWVGCYLEKRGELLLGPFQGKPACIHIPGEKVFAGQRRSRIACFWCRMFMLFPAISPVTAPAVQSSCCLFTARRAGSAACWIWTVPWKIGLLEEDAAGLGEIVRLLEKGCDWED